MTYFEANELLQEISSKIPAEEFQEFYTYLLENIVREYGEEFGQEALEIMLKSIVG